MEILLNKDIKIKTKRHDNANKPQLRNETIDKLNEGKKWISFEMQEPLIMNRNLIINRPFTLPDGEIPNENAKAALVEIAAFSASVVSHS